MDSSARIAVAATLWSLCACTPTIPEGIPCGTTEPRCPEGFMCLPGRDADEPAACFSSCEAARGRCDGFDAGVDAGVPDAGDAMDAAMPMDAGPADSGASDAGGLVGCVPSCSDGDAPCFYHFDGGVPDGGGPPITCDEAEDVQVGSLHTCALLRHSRRVACWGLNDDGQLGIGTTPPSARPRPVIVQRSSSINAPLENIVQIAVGASHTCALDVAGQAWCWGLNKPDRIGVGSENIKVIARARRVLGGRTYHDIAAGVSHTCAIEGTPGISARGRVWCWGRNTSGVIGNASLAIGVRADTPTLVYQGRLRANDIEAGDYTTCAAIDTDPDPDFESIHCWGDHNDDSLGRPMIENDCGGTGFCTDTPAPVETADGSALTDVSVWALGARHGCAVSGDGLVCWGDNDDLQLGAALPVEGDFARHVDPSDLTTIGLDVTRSDFFLALGENTSCAGDRDSFWCWGDNEYGFSRPDDMGSRQPVGCSGLAAVDFDARGRLACIRRCERGDRVQCWGDPFSNDVLGRGCVGSGAAVPGDVLSVVDSADAAPPCDGGP